MLDRGKGARAYRTAITLTKAEVSTDDFGHAVFSAPVDVREVFAAVSQMSATKTMMTFQQADIVGLDIEFRNPLVEYNGIRWNGHDVHFSQPENVDMRGRIIRIQGWYQQDNPDYAD